MESDTTDAIAALAAATLALLGGYTALTAFVAGATATIEMVGYAVGALLVFEGASAFTTFYARLE